MNRRVLRFGAIIGAATVSTLAIAPVFAAAPVSQSTSNALTLSIAGSPISSGTLKASNDGTTETKTGATNPAIVGALKNQSLLNIGVAAQAAEAKVKGQDGVSAACGGIAGEGAAFAAEIGDSNCLTPGQPVGLNIANLDLSGATLIDPASQLGALGGITNPILTQILGPILAQVTAALAPIKDVGLGGTLGAVYSRCTAKPGSAEGGANIVDSKISLTLPAPVGEIVLVSLPVHPAPNTKVLTDLDQVLDAVLDGLTVQLTDIFNGQLSAVLQPVVALFPTIKAQLIDTVIAQVADALAPLEDNVLSITLNKQVKTADTIDVTALDLQVLPALAQFTGGALVSAQIGHVTCGPNGKVAAPTPTATPTNPTEPPTVVDSGARGTGSNTVRDVLVATAALMLLAGSAGLIGYRRMLTK